jgi:hypothetical protein
MQGVRSSSQTKQLAKVNMLSILSRFGKASKVNKYVLEMDNYYDVQRSERTSKVAKVVTFFIDHALE